MTELEAKAKEYAQKYINHKMAIHDIFDLEVVQRDITRLLAEFATEATKELREENLKLEAKVRTLEIEQHYCMPNCSKVTDLEAQIEKMKCCINDLVHLGEFNEHTDEEYFNYQVHEALKNAEQFIKEIKEK